MLNWLNHWLNRSPSVRLTQEEADFLDELIAIADPKIRLADDYQKTLAPLFLAARDQVHRLLAQVPELIRLSPENWRQNALLGCAFASPDRMREAVNADQRLRQWFADHPLAESAFAILSMSHEQAIRYGMEEEGGMVRQDVPQEVLVLRQHRFGRPAPSLEGLQRLACHRAMEELATHAARRILGLNDDKKEIEDDISTLRLALRLNGPVTEFELQPEQRARQAKLAKLLENLAQVRTELEPVNLLKILASALHDPEQQLRFSLLSLHVDTLGVIRPTGRDSKPVTLIEIEIMEDNPTRRVLIPVEIPRNLMQPPQAQSDDFLNFALL